MRPKLPLDETSVVPGAVVVLLEDVTISSAKRYLDRHETARRAAS